MPDTTSVSTAADIGTVFEMLAQYRLVFEIAALVIVAMIIGYFLGRAALKRRETFQTQMLSNRERYWRRRVSSKQRTTDRLNSGKMRKLRTERRKKSELRTA
ncbi:MAG: hypothetical protein AAFV45_14415 [Pseudomonadota bacterium]